MNGNIKSNLKHIPTRKLQELVNNDFVSEVGTDYEPLKEELLELYLKRLDTLCTKVHKLALNELDMYQDYLDSLPPPFVFTYDDETDSYIEF